MKKVLIVVTSARHIHSEKPTGLWLSEFAEPFIEFTKAGYEITVASPLGGQTPIDPSSLSDDLHQEILDTQKHLANTLPLEEVKAEQFDAIVLPGGHGTMFDLPENEKLQALIRGLYEADKVVAAVCHGPAGLVNVTLSNGKHLVEGKRITAFTDSEEHAAGLASSMPFLLESKLREAGPEFIAAPDWSEHVEVDGNLITGQNPQSSLEVAKAVVAKLASN